MRNLLFAIWMVLPACFANGQSGQKQPGSQNDTTYTFRPASADGTGKFYLGREIAPVMGPGGSAWLERKERRQEENTDQAIDSIQLAPAATVADIGAGTGYYTFRLSRKAPKGRIYAVEVQDAMIRMLKGRKKSLADSCVVVVKGSSLSPNLPDSSIDLAIMVDVYHELLNPREMLQAIKKSLKPGGRILLIEYRGEDPSIPIRALHKTTVDQLNREMKANGLVLAYRGEFLPIQHFLLYRRQ